MLEETLKPIPFNPETNSLKYLPLYLVLNPGTFSISTNFGDITLIARK